MNEKVGKFIEVIRLEDPYVDINQGDRGKIIRIEDNGELKVHFLDKNIFYNINPDIDEYSVLEYQTYNEDKYVIRFSDFLINESHKNPDFDYAVAKVEEFSEIFSSDNSIESRFSWRKKNSNINIIEVDVSYLNPGIGLEYSYQWTIDVNKLEIFKIFFSNQPDVDEYSQEESFNTIEECMDWLRRDLMDYIILYENNQNYFLLEKNIPLNPKLWSSCKSWAKQRYEVWPSAYAVGAAAKRYKQKGGRWKKKNKKTTTKK